MRVVVQRSLNSSVSVEGKIVGSIDKGLVLLVGFNNEDTIDDIDYMVHKISNLRIFDDENGNMNLSIRDIEGDILSISQFTLYGDAKKGNRPNYTKALAYDEANNLFDLFNDKLKQENIELATGIFGEEMQVSLVNDGPVTIILESGEIL